MNEACLYVYTIYSIVSCKTVINKCFRFLWTILCARVQYLCTKKACDLSTVNLFPCGNQGKEKEPPDQSVAQETNNTPMSPILVDGTDDDDEEESSLDEFYESLDNIFDVS